MGENDEGERREKEKRRPKGKQKENGFIVIRREQMREGARPAVLAGFAPRLAPVYAQSHTRTHTHARAFEDPDGGK